MFEVSFTRTSLIGRK